MDKSAEVPGKVQEAVRGIDVKLQAKVNHFLVAELDFLAAHEWVTRNDVINKLLRWGLESIDPKTGRLPDVHPSTGRQLEDIMGGIPPVHNRVKAEEKKV